MERINARNSHLSVWTGKRSRSVHVRKPIRGRASNGQSAQGILRHAGEFDLRTKPKMIGIIVFQQMMATDLMGPAETFSRAVISTDNDRDRRCYQVVTIGVNIEDCVT